MIDIGRLNKRITFCRYEEVENELHQLKQELVEVKKVWASVEPTRGKEYTEAQRLRPELTYKIYTRYLSGITPDMYIKYKNMIFEIVSVADVRMNNEILEIYCTEKIKKEGEEYGGES